MGSMVSIRPATGTDYPHFVRLFRELVVDDPVPSQLDWDAHLCGATIFAESEGVPVGYGFCEVFKNVGYVRHLVVDGAQRRKGIGRHLMQTMAAGLHAAGCERWRLNVRMENVAACRLYESLGLAPVYRTTALSIPWDRVTALPTPEQTMQVQSIEPADDDVLETRFDLAPRQLSALRARGGLVLLRIGEPAAPAARALGVASFSPSFPGASPFKVSDSKVTRSLLEAIHPHARPADREVRLVIEGDAATRALLIGAGATVRAELFHYRGTVPAQ